MLGSIMNVVKTPAAAALLVACLSLACGVDAASPPPPVQPTMRFDPAADFAAWQEQLRARLIEILALPPGPHGPLEATIVREDETEQYTLDRVDFTSEPGERVPGYLLRPKAARPPLPVMICLQGHSPGMHISIGRCRRRANRNRSRAGATSPCRRSRMAGPPWPSSSERSGFGPGRQSGARMPRSTAC